eukprot:CAMPEP_0172213018 /NCGR_PEP_ID=MMETSP1050-20130122/37356_1 /TAXON_ID=233186 /ORGANISM="Cryptomonas curvata, Strain CCAP979/52" /LENGTH=143 /DNA_ID=CAMNT_0012893797 /DNA_START=311 /DNA_END=742 /DNA_ORIENTATION=+
MISSVAGLNLNLKNVIDFLAGSVVESGLTEEEKTVARQIKEAPRFYPKLEKALVPFNRRREEARSQLEDEMDRIILEQTVQSARANKLMAELEAVNQKRTELTAELDAIGKKLNSHNSEWEEKWRVYIASYATLLMRSMGFPV